MRPLLVLLTLAVAAMPLAAQEPRVLPIDPQAGESFAVVSAYSFMRPVCHFVTGSSRANSSTVTIEQPQSPFGQVEPDGRRGWCRYGAPIAGLPAGAYKVIVPPLQNDNGIFGQAPPFEIALAISPSSATAPRYRDLDGNWFNPAQPGWGMNLVQGDSGALFGVWLTYVEINSLDPNPSEWMVMPEGRWISPTRFRGLLYASAGRPVQQPPAASRVAPIGMVTLDFPSQERMTFSVVRANIAGEWKQSQSTLQRFEF